MKKIFEDMVPDPNRKTIRDLNIPNRNDRGRLSTKINDVVPEVNENKVPASVASLYGAPDALVANREARDSSGPVISKKWSDQYRAPVSIEDVASKSGGYNRKSNSWLRRGVVFFVFSGLLVSGAGLVLWTFLFSSVRIDITPLSQKVKLNSLTLSAQKKGDASGVPYDIITLSDEGIKKVAPSGVRRVQRASTGKVVLYNNFSNKPQRLIRNTRLETPAGLIFRIVDSVTIPGKTTVADKDTPGSVTSLIIADTPGDKSNIAMSDFSIPGFKGDPRYTKFYGRSASPMTGGFVGTERVVSDDILHTAQSQVQTETIAKLTSKIKAGLALDQVLYDGSIYSESEMEPTVEDGNAVAVKAKVTLYAVVFSKQTLAKYIAEANITHFDESAVTLDSPELLQFSILNKDEVRPWIDQSFNFTLSGTTKIIWLFDEAKLKQALVNQPKQSFYSILPNFPSIGTATVHFNPVWKSTFPSDAKGIIIRKI